MAACPCGSGATLADCCGQLLDGGAAVTAEALMRSRYTAFVGRRSDYLLATWAPEKRPSALDLSRDRTEWLGLQIVAVVAGGPDDAVGEVEFIARYRSPAGAGAQRERSRFRREAGRWLYVDGQVAAVPQPGEAAARSGAGVGRNDPCPCGSGSKWKRCCGR
ncbi:MAG: SEC-C domain-containing protein [Myxococcales bacterium]|nr:SEC-C domain-containing protein [Myxococcales bacterium]